MERVLTRVVYVPVICPAGCDADDGAVVPDDPPDAPDLAGIAVSGAA